MFFANKATVQVYSGFCSNWLFIVAHYNFKLGVTSSLEERPELKTRPIKKVRNKMELKLRTTTYRSYPYLKCKLADKPASKEAKKSCNFAAEW